MYIYMYIYIYLYVCVYIKLTGPLSLCFRWTHLVRPASPALRQKRGVVLPREVPHREVLPREVQRPSGT